jgi:oligopeptide transport system substrate-binding protein
MRRMDSARRARPLLWTIPVGLLTLLLASAWARSRSASLARADFVFNNSAEIATLDPARVTGVPEGRILRAVFEGLCLRDPRTLRPLPGAAESWSIGPKGLKYRFKLRDDARWTNSDPVTAHDFEWSLRRVLTPATGAQYAYQLYCIRGARELHTGLDAQGRSVQPGQAPLGILAEDERTLVIELVRPTPSFLGLMSFYPFYPVNRRSLEEARAKWPDTWEVEWVKPEHLVSNGPFRVVERRINDRIRLVKNHDYWDADNVAFESIDALAVQHATCALNMYLTGDIDWIDGGVPTSLTARLRGREDFVPRPFLGTYFYRVNTTKPPFDDARVRKALSLTIPRNAICKRILKAGQVPLEGLVPAVNMNGYVSPQPKDAFPGPDTPLDPEDFMDLGGPEQGREGVVKARALLRQAGYGPRGNKLPPISIHYNTSELHRDIAEVIGHAWEQNLGLKVRYRNQEWKVFLEAQEGLSYDVSRSSWIADCPDALNFLEVFVSGGANNRTGWSNASYDKLIAEAQGERDNQRRNRLLQEAERILIEEAPILPIYGYVTQNLVNPRLGGFFDNQLNEQYPKFWYWRDDAELEDYRRSRPRGLQPINAPGPRQGLYAPATREQKARGR